MPQWDFLNFLAEQGRRYPDFHLLMRAEATDLIADGGRVVGLRAKTPDGELEIRADLVVGCDGRHSTVRERAGFDGRGHRRADRRAVVPAVAARRATPTETCGHIEAGQMMVMLNRGDYWQCAYVIPKGGIEAVKREGLPAFRERVRRAVAVPARPRRRIEELRRHQAADGGDRPAAAMAPAGPALHRRCRARDVAGRRRRRQSRGAGRGRRRQHPGRAAARRRRDDRASRRRAAAPRIPDAGHPADAGDRAEQAAVARAGEQRAAEAAVRSCG